MVNVVFLHPDLGIGGAERAVIDAALALQSHGHRVQFVTAHHDVTHCFQETKDGTVNVISADMLLTKRNSLLKKLYRAPIDWLEEKTTGMADCVLVNSNFTAGIFHDAFSSLNNIQPKVLYPIPNFTSFNKSVEPPTEKLIPPNKELVFLSINRYERKKNLGLALQAFGKLKENFPDLKYIHLIMAGGYDSRVKENVDHYLELRQLAAKLNLGEDVTFLKSFTDSEKKTLLKYASCLLYTPENEHFGIVPIEAMYMKCPVIAVKSGGPLETIDDGKTGFLCEPTPASFSESMEKFLVDRNLREKIGSAGKERVLAKFSFKQFASTLNEIVTEMV